MLALAPLLGSWLLGALLLLVDGRKRPVVAVAILGLAAVLAADVVLLIAAAGRSSPLLETVTGAWPAGIGIRLRVDALALLFGTICALVITAATVHEARMGIRSRLLPALLLLLCAGLHGAFFTGDLFDFYVFFELSMVTSFALATYGFGRAELRGTLTYVAVNLLGSAMFLAGVASIYRSTGTLDFLQIADRISELPGDPLLIPTTLLFVALALKLGLFPFHGWVPALYGNVRRGIAAVLAGALVNIGVFGLLRLAMFAAPEAGIGGRPVILVLGAAAILYGSVLALRRRRPEEIVAYAAVVHAGYLVLALGIGGTAGFTALLALVVAGSIDKALMFVAVDTSGRSRSATALVGAAGIAGLPPSASFVAKLALLRAAVDAPAAGAIITVVVAAAVLTIAAAIRYRRLVLGEYLPRRGSAVMPVVLALASTAITVWPRPLLALSHAIGGSLSREELA